MTKTAVKLALAFALFTCIPALAEDAIPITITPPASDLVTSAKPFAISVTMPEALADAGPSSAVELRRAEPGLEKDKPIAASVRLTPVKADGKAACIVTLDASKLAEGEYAGTITVAAGNAKQSAPFTMFRMPEGRPKDFPYGTYAVRFHSAPDPVTKKQVPDKAQQHETFREMQAAGINLIQQHMNGLESYTWTMDQAARYGMWFQPSTNVLGHGLEQKEDILAVPGDGKTTDSWLKVCMFTPKVREKSVEKYQEAIRGGILEQIDALCLYDVRALPDDVNKLLEDWAAKGGKLYVHNEGSLKPKGSVSMSMETMIAVIGDNTPRPLFDNRDITVRELASGDARYYVFINNYTDRYWGLVHHYGKPGNNYRDLELVRNKPASTTVTFPEKDRWLFDMSTGEALGSTNDAFGLDLEPSWGRAIIALPVKAAKLNIAGPDAVKQGETATWAVKVLGSKDEPVPGAFTVKATIITPSGRTSRYSCPLGIQNGAGELRLPIGANDEPGTWRLTFEGGFPRTKVTRKLKVRAGPAIDNILR